MPDILNQAHHTRNLYHTLSQCHLDEVAPPLLHLKGRVTGTVGMTVTDITSAAGIDLLSGT